MCALGASVSCTATISQYPGYSATSPAGTVKVSEGSSSAQITLEYALSGLAPGSTGGLHLHTGTTCDRASSVGPHYWTPASSADPWTTTYAASSASGTSFGSLSLFSGYSVSLNVGHAVVVHDSTARIGCGVCVEDSSSGGLSDAEIAAIVVCSIALVFAICLGGWLALDRQRKRNTQELIEDDSMPATGQAMPATGQAMQMGHHEHDSHVQKMDRM